MMDHKDCIFVAGHRGTAGTAIVEQLKKRGYQNIVTRTHAELDLCNQQAVNQFFEETRPDYVFNCAVKPCGAANTRDKADFIYQNIMMQSNLIHASYLNHIKKLISFGSGYMYPEMAENPLKEDCMLTGRLNWGVEYYGIAKIANAKMCEAYNLQYHTEFFTVVINNLYGTRAEFDFKKARVLPALLRKFHLAKLLRENKNQEVLQDLKMTDFHEAQAYLANVGVTADAVEIWGTGKARREFIHCDDVADACIYLMNTITFEDLKKFESDEIRTTQINLGTGMDYAIGDVARMIQEIVGFKGELRFDATKPDSNMNRVMDCRKIHELGWHHHIDLDAGIRMMYDWYLSQV